MQILFMIAFSIIVLGLLIGSIWYVPFRLSRLAGVTRRWPFYIATIVIVLLYPLTRVLLEIITSPILDILASTASVLFGLHFYIFLLLLLIEIPRMVIHTPDRITALSLVIVAVVITSIGALRANSFRVSETEIFIKGLERDVTLMHISDAHIGPQRGREYLAQIVKETNSLNPQLVLINGDLVDANIALDPDVLSPLADFKAPVYFTTGNHESYVDTTRALEIIAGYGVHVLRNEMVETHGMQLVGLDYMNADENRFDMHAVNKLTIKEELPKIPLNEENPIVLMHHSPVGLQYVCDRGVALMLSGHTHAGQIFPITLVAELLFPLNKGLHKIGNTQFFVSQGAGTFGPRMRLGTSNEINFIRLLTDNR